MQDRFSGLRLLVVLVALCTGLVTAGGTSPAAGVIADRVLAGAAPAVCADVARCRVVARADVTGDGDRDVVAVARRGKQGAEQGAVIVRVRTAEGQLVAARRRTEIWHGSVWQGAGRLDGRPGNEVVVGRTQGAHAEFFTVLTWRHGRLVTLDAPGRGRWWGVDAAVWIDLGWQHRKGDPEGVIRKRLAMREGDATEGPFRGRVTSYRWTHDGWDRTHRRVVYPMSAQRAATWGGWKVRGIARW